MAPPLPPTEPQAEEMLAFQRLLEEYFVSNTWERRAKLIAQVRGLARDKDDARVGVYALELIRVLLDLGQINDVIYVATFIPNNGGRIALKRILKGPRRERLTTEPTSPKEPQLPRVPARATHAPSTVMVAKTEIKSGLSVPPIKEEHPTPFDRHRNAVKEKLAPIFAHGRTALSFLKSLRRKP